MLHGDIEHLYVVDLNERLIEHYKVSLGSNYETQEKLRESRKPDHVYKLDDDSETQNIDEIEVNREELEAQ